MIGIEVHNCTKKIIQIFSMIDILCSITIKESIKFGMAMFNCLLRELPKGLVMLFNEFRNMPCHDMNLCCC